MSLGIAERLVAEETLKMTMCERCNTQEDTLVVRVFSKFFVASILFFAFKKRVHIECISCKRMEKSIDSFPKRTQDRIEAVVGDAKHPWYLYSGYVIFFILIVISLVSK